MRIAVTGATGFIGQYVVRALCAMKHEPTLIVRASSTVPVEFQSLPRVDFEIGSDPEAVFEESGRPELLIHLAWGGLPHYHSLHHVSDELPAQYDFLKAMTEAGLSKLVVTGTCLEYGMQYGPLDENASAQPHTAYGSAKFNLLNLLTRLSQQQAFDLTWVRPFYLYGDGQAESSLFSQLFRAAMAGDARFPMSGGEQLRDFMSIEQFAREFVDLSLESGGHGIVNLCKGEPISVRHLVEGWIEKNAWTISPKLGVYEYPEYEPMAFWGLRGKLDNILGR